MSMTASPDMRKAFEILGLPADASREQVKKAYHQQAKANHPDLQQDPMDQAEAQRRMVALNLAYEQAMAVAVKPRTGFHKLPLEQCKQVVRRLIDQGHYDSALLQLGRAEGRDAHWYALQGEVMMGLKEYATAHQCFREAVRQQPDNMRFREFALDAALAVKRNKYFPQRLKDSIQGLILGRKRR